MSKLVLGIDVGTQGARVILANERGDVIAEASRPFRAEIPGLPQGWFEQDPDVWWRAVCSCLAEIHDSLRLGVAAISVDSTSGTIIAIDDRGQPLRPAIMYNDQRARAQAEYLNEKGGDLTRKLGYGFNPSFGLPKILWIKDNEPKIFEQCRMFVHAADWVAGKLTGMQGFSDSSNALKSGYDLIDLCWPDVVLHEIPSDKLPAVMTPGEEVGTVCRECTEETGLPVGTKVVAGVSDGTAGFIASGAATPGDWNTTLGTTLVMRGISHDLIRDPMGRFYCHRHPDGWWLPGGASNVGGECLTRLFPDDSLAELDLEAAACIPTGFLVYPLVRKGERLPFVDPDAEGFVAIANDMHTVCPAERGNFPLSTCGAGKRHDISSARNCSSLLDQGTSAWVGNLRFYAGCLEGVAFTERWILEEAHKLGADTGGVIFTTGGGAKSDVWLRIRASVLGKLIVRPRTAECAMGAAIVAASRTLFSNLTEAGWSMTARPDAIIEPESVLARAYDDLYNRFRDECNRHFGIS